MKIRVVILTLLLVLTGVSFSQSDTIHNAPKGKIKLKSTRETQDNWAVNLMFSDNGFGLGATKFKTLSKDVSFFAGFAFSGAKDDREFEQVDIFGNTYTPDKLNRLFMAMINIGAQVRLFREDVTDNLRPYFNFGATPTAIMYTPYERSFFPAFGYMQAKYTVGAFAGIGLDYVTNKHSSLSMNVRGYYINLFKQGVYSLSTQEKKFFGGVYFVFAYNFMH